jgi:TonB-linked SusC/RagA family outer membrane protein
MKKDDSKKLPRKMKLRNLFSALVASFVFLPLTYAQVLPVTGKVTSAGTGELIPGVNVSIEGTTTGTATNMDGSYTIEVPNSAVVLRFSFIGYLSQKIPVNGQSVIDVGLVEDIMALDELVVVGYGTQKKADLSSAIAVVAPEELARKPVATFQQALQGLSAGVSVTGNRGAPGEGASIRIRGVGSVNNTNPLIIIDGIRVEGTSSIIPDNIESVQILKDAAAAAIYGSRGANGVILITTKRGKSGKPQVSFDSYYGIQSAWKQMDLLHSEEYCKLVNETSYNAGEKGPVATRDPYNQEYDTDWQAAMFRTAPIQKYGLSFSAGDEKSSHYFSVGYFSQDGIMIGTSYKKYYATLNNDTRFGRLKLGESLALSFDRKENEPSAGSRSQIEQILKIPPTMPIYDSANLGGFAGPSNEDGHDGANPVAVANTHIGIDKNYEILGNIYADLEIIKGLDFISRLGVDFIYSDNSYLLKAHEMGDAGGVGETSQDITNRNYINIVFENTLSYYREIGKNTVKALIGYTAEQQTDKFIYASRTNFPSDDMTLHTGLTNIMNDGQEYESALLSQLARIEYGYADKYLLTVNVRRDGSSKFGSNYRYGIFPSFSAAWRISKENFLAGSNIISDMKLRASYGTIGNQDIGDYGYEASLSSYFNYSFNDKLVTGIGPDNFANEDLHWETTTMTDIGLDIGLFKNKLYLTADYYDKKTKDMLLQLTIPRSVGLIDQIPYQNAGSVLNRGLEFSLSYKEYETKFKYSVSVNFAYLYNEVLSLGEGGIPVIAGRVETQTSGISITDVGLPIGSFYLYRTDGLYQTTDAYVNAKGEWVVNNQLYSFITRPNGRIDTLYFQPKAQPGDIRYKDLNNDQILNDKDREYAGSPIPKYEYALNLTAEYMGFDLNLFCQGVYGNKIYNENRTWTEGMFANWNGSVKTLDRYRAKDVSISTKTKDGTEVTVFYPANTDTDIPRAILRDPNKNTLRGSDRFLEDGSYLRLKTLTLGYSLPESLTSKIQLSKVRIYFTAQNLLTFTHYSGYDPEIGSAPIGDSDNQANPKINLVRGIDNGYFPQARVLMGGLQITF